MSNFWDKVQELADEAPEAGFPQLNYGKLTITPMVVTWKGKGQKPEVNEMAEGQELKDRQTLRLRFTIDVKEFNPSLEFEWYREVDVRKSGKGKDNLTDWSEIVLPSLENVFGKKWAKSAEGSYVEVEDVPSTRGTYKNVAGEEKQLNTIKFLRKFDNKESCLAARDETYKKRDGSEDGDLPADVVVTCKSLYQSLNQNDEMFKTVAASDDRLKNYDVEILLAAANPL